MTLGNPILGINDAAYAFRQAKPQAFRVADSCRDVGIKGFRPDRLEQLVVLRAPEATGIDGDQDIGRAGIALGMDTLHQRIFLALDQVDLNTRFFGEQFIEVAVGIVMTTGIDIHFCCLGGWSHDGNPSQNGTGGKQVVCKGAHGFVSR